MTTDLSNRSRQPKGSPVGGELKAEQRSRGADLEQAIRPNLPTRPPDKKEEGPYKGTRQETWEHERNGCHLRATYDTSESGEEYLLRIEWDVAPDLDTPHTQYFNETGTLIYKELDTARGIQGFSYHDNGALELETHITHGAVSEYRTEYDQQGHLILEDTVSTLPGVALERKTYTPEGQLEEKLYLRKDTGRWSTDASSPGWWAIPGRVPMRPGEDVGEGVKRWAWPDGKEFFAEYNEQGGLLSTRWGTLSPDPKHIPTRTTFRPDGAVSEDVHVYSSVQGKTQTEVRQYDEAGSLTSYESTWDGDVFAAVNVRGEDDFDTIKRTENGPVHATYVDRQLASRAAHL